MRHPEKIPARLKPTKKAVHANKRRFVTRPKSTTERIPRTQKSARAARRPKRSASKPQTLKPTNWPVARRSSGASCKRKKQLAHLSNNDECQMQQVEGCKYHCSSSP